jgi:hypothetical protein
MVAVSFSCSNSREKNPVQKVLYDLKLDELGLKKLFLNESLDSIRGRFGEIIYNADDGLCYLLDTLRMKDSQLPVEIMVYVANNSVAGMSSKIPVEDVSFFRRYWDLFEFEYDQKGWNHYRTDNFEIDARFNYYGPTTFEITSRVFDYDVSKEEKEVVQSH